MAYELWNLAKIDFGYSLLNDKLLKPVKTTNIILFSENIWDLEYVNNVTMLW